MNNTDHISDMDIVSFNGKELKVRTVHINHVGDRMIGTVSLEEELFKDDTYVSEEARTIDERIFFYVEDKYINFDDKKLAEHVAECLC